MKTVGGSKLHQTGCRKASLVQTESPASEFARNLDSDKRPSVYNVLVKRDGGGKENRLCAVFLSAAATVPAESDTAMARLLPSPSSAFDALLCHWPALPRHVFYAT